MKVWTCSCGFASKETAISTAAARIFQSKTATGHPKTKHTQTQHPHTFLPHAPTRSNTLVTSRTAVSLLPTDYVRRNNTAVSWPHAPRVLLRARYARGTHTHTRLNENKHSNKRRTGAISRGTAHRTSLSGGGGGPAGAASSSRPATPSCTAISHADVRCSANGMRHALSARATCRCPHRDP